MGLFDSIPSHMDYQGQKFSEQLFQILAVTFGIIGFVVGYVFQQMSYMMYILGVGCALGCLVTLPPWPMYRRNPVGWQKPQRETEAPPTQQQKGNKKKQK